MAQSVQNHAFDPYLPPKCQILAPKNDNFKPAKILKHETPSISETTKPMDLKI